MGNSKWSTLLVWTGRHFHFPFIWKQVGVQDPTFESSNNVM